MRKCILLFWIVGVLLYGDGVFLWEGDYSGLREADQLAFIYHEEQKETLVLSIRYDGRVGNFAWVIPVPSLPKVKLGPENFFYALSDLFVTIGHPRSHLGPVMGKPGRDGEFVSVISREIIGDYDVAILSSTDPDALYRWCDIEGYKLPPKASEVLKPYIDRKWFFVAVKVAAGKKTKGKTLRGELPPLIIEFDSRAIVYPLRISTLNREYVDPKVSKIEEWMGQKIVFMKEWEGIASKIIKQTKEERHRSLPYKDTLLHKLGFDELEKSYEKSLNGEMELADFEALLDMAVNDILESIAHREISGLELTVVAPYYVKPGGGTPVDIMAHLQILFQTQLGTIVFKEYFLDENKNPLFSPSQTMCLTHLSGRLPFSLFTGDLYLVKQ